MSTQRLRSIAILGSLLILAAIPVTAEASHSWNGYHWARTSNPFTVKVIDSMTSNWDDNLGVAISDWGASSVLNVTKEAGEDSTRTRKRCRAVTGKVRVCNATYGNNGWLGIAQIWVSGKHIVQGVAKMNDTYLATSAYNETARQHVICQEIGHEWGLDHQDESGADLNTCMDYSDALDNPHPNRHDYDQLESIYAHLDSTSTVAPLTAGFANADVRAQSNWGRKVHEAADGRSAVFVRHFGGGRHVYTHVIWAQ
ncbi:MAG TPA: hypothetical protein VGQ89_07390 [Candidatus Limnocylindrales bacterium]|jgi:hypothetical protein|nr:hypothetical protein [Candidatus Limnocylindrales bacterium]